MSVDMGISAPFPYTGAGGEGYCSNADCPDYSLIGPFGQVSTWYNKYWDGSRNPQGEEIWNPWCYAEPIYSNVDGNYSACDPQSGYWNWLVRYDPRIFLPYVEQGGGTSTHVAVQNPGSFATIVDVKLFDLSGNQVASASRNLLSGGSYLFDFPGISLPDGKGYAVVRGNNRNLTVLGKIQNPFRASGYTGTVGEDGTATSILGLGYADTRLYVPLVKKYWYGHTGAIHVLNVGRGSTFVQLDFKAESSGTGSDCTYADPTALGPGQSRTYDLHSDILPAGCLVNGRWLGAATITAVSSGPSYQEPLVVVAADLGDAGTADQNHAMRYNAFRVGAWEAYVPLVKKAWYGGSTGIMVMNVGNAVAYVLVDFYACYAGDCTNQYTVPDPNTPALIEPGRGKSFYAPPGVPDGFLGSAKVRSTNQQTVVAMANDIYASKKTNESTSAFLPGWTQSVHLPLNFRQGSHMGWTQWEGGIQVQNTGTGYLTQLSVEYFDQNGNLVLSRNLNDAYPPNLGSLAPNRSVNYYAPPIPSQYLPFQGAVKISANGPVVAISNLTATDASTTVDASVGYNGYPR
ncbi:MAG: hypothetical protein HY331_18660 [Chloroflexi bacterium]|nr:hypothetical protein [Chloroflexota bacterium]